MTDNIKPGLGELLRYLVELSDGSSDSYYKTLDFNYRPRYTPIMRALEHGAASIKTLQENLSITQGAISQTIKLMISDGLITKRKGQDARHSIVGLTRQGEKALSVLMPYWQVMLLAIEKLEGETDHALMHCLTSAIEALEKKPLVERINSVMTKQGISWHKIDDKAYFNTEAENYAAYRPSYPPELAKSLADLCSGHQLALDVGCGNGQLTSLLAPHFGQVVGTDPSEKQLEHAKVADNISYLNQAAECIELAENSVDLVVVAQAAHWFDLEKFYAQVRKVAKPEAVIALVSYGVPYIDDPINAIFQKGYWQDVHQFWPAARRHVENSYADLYFPFVSIPVPSPNIKRSMTVVQFTRYIKTWSAYGNAKELNDLDKFERFLGSLTQVWPESETKQVIWPISIKAAQI